MPIRHEPNPEEMRRQSDSYIKDKMMGLLTEFVSEVKLIRKAFERMAEATETGRPMAGPREELPIPEVCPYCHFGKIRVIEKCFDSVKVTCPECADRWRLFRYRDQINKLCDPKAGEWQAMSRTHHHRGRPKPDVLLHGKKTKTVRYDWDARHNGYVYRRDPSYGDWPDERWRTAEKLVGVATRQGFILYSKVESDEVHVEGFPCQAMKRLRKELGKLLGLTEAELRHRESMVKK